MPVNPEPATGMDIFSLLQPFFKENFWNECLVAHKT
jgi:hypothetical protein